MGDYMEALIYQWEFVDNPDLGLWVSLTSGDNVQYWLTNALL
jgi:hypothetical protein